jgi:hypothetical protein
MGGRRERGEGKVEKQKSDEIQLEASSRPSKVSDGRRGNISGRCALYIDSNDQERKIYLTKEFNSDPYLFLTSNFFVQNLLIEDHDLGKRFHYIEQPKSALTSYLGEDPCCTYRWNFGGI